MRINCPNCNCTIDADEVYAKQEKVRIFTLKLDDILDFAMVDPRYAVALRPQLEKLVETLGATSNKSS